MELRNLTFIEYEVIFAWLLNLAYIPESFNAPHREEFDTEFMRTLFQTGFDMAVKGYPWEKVPPGY